MKSIVKKPTVAIVGRTNVGKSTLFNRLIEEAKALVSPIPGTTRSPNYGEVIWRGRIFTAVDTGGLERRTDDPFEADIRRQAERAMRDADLIVFVADLRIGLTPEDRELAKILKRSRQPVILAGNKADRPDSRERATDPAWAALGFGKMFAIAAATGMGVGDLLDEVFRIFKDKEIKLPTIEEELNPIRVAIIGKPNVGKSSLLNALVGAPRAIVSEISHTTREPQDTLMRLNDDYFLFIDTAGIRQKMKVGSSLEAAGIRKSLEALRRSDLAFFVVDMVEGVGAQDRHLGGLLTESQKGLIIVGNKWDLAPEKSAKTYTEVKRNLTGLLNFIDWAPNVLVSAKTGEHTQKLFELAKQVKENRKRMLEPAQLDYFIRQSIRKHRPIGRGVKHPYIYGMKQTGIEPPSYVLSVRGARDSVHATYLRFLERRLREKFDLFGTPIVILSKTIRPTV